jgi:hypothetical protein
VVQSASRLTRRLPSPHRKRCGRTQAGHETPGRKETMKDQDQDRPPCWGPAIMLGLAAWAAIAAVGWLVWEVAR